MFRVVIRVDASDVSELLESTPLLKSRLSEKYRCLGTSTSFICIADDNTLVKVIPTLAKGVSAVKEEPLIPSPRPYFLVIIETTSLSRLATVWDTITNTLKNLSLRYTLME